MTYSLVQAGTVLDNSATATTSPVSVTCASTTAHNLLVMPVFVHNNAAVITLPAGWLKSNAGFAWADIWYYPDCPAGITSVSVAFSGSAVINFAQLLEFHDSAGTNTSPLDVGGSGSSITATPAAIATSIATNAANDLAVSFFTGGYASATKDTFVAGTGFTSAGGVGQAIKQITHATFDYKLNSGATGVQTDSITFAGGALNSSESPTGNRGVIATFKVYTAPTGAPTVVVYKDAYSLGTTFALTQRTVATGDVVAVVATTEDFANLTSTALAQTAGTATIGTVTTRQDAGGASHAGLVLYTFTVTSGGTLTLTVTNTGNSRERTVWTFVATGCGGVGNTAKTTSAASTITASLTTSANSYVLAIAADWAATGGATTTLTPGGGTLDAHETDGVTDQAGNGSHYSVRGGHWADSGAPATTSYGVTVPTSTGYNLVVCELLGTGTAPGLLPQQVRSRHPAYWTRISAPASQGAVYSR